MADVNIHQVPAAQIARQVATQEYTKLIGGNDYQGEKNEYSATNKDAISDGDAKGRGENNGQVGTIIDQTEFKKLTTVNLFSTGKPYVNPDTNTAY